MRIHQVVSGLTCGLLVASATIAQEQQPASRYPIGTVIAPDGNQVPSREQQRFHHDWAAQAGMNVVETEMMPVAGGYFDWALIQPEPGKFNWEPYDFFVEDAERAGMDAYFEVFTWKNPPKWLFDAAGDIYMHTPLGGADELTPAVRNDELDTNTFVSVAHPKLIEATERYAGEVARRYKDRKAVRGYIIAEEFGLCAIWPKSNYYGIDFSPSMREAFHRRLKEKYGTIDAVNQAWGHPGRYKDFAEIVWKKGWSHDPKNFRGEWLDYYLTLQEVFAEYHNRIARAIKAEDPDAIVMVSDFQTMVNRVGHGAYPPLFTDIDAFAFKSYWNDTRMQADWCAGITGGNKQVWCSNFTEDDTTRNGLEKRYMVPQYIKRQFFPAFARGMDGLFLFIWTPWQPEKMSVLQHTSDQNHYEPIPAVQTVNQLSEFMNRHWAELSAFAPAAPRVAVHDPNITYIAQHWDYADPKPLREKWFTETRAIQSFHKTVDLLAEHNRRFTISTEGSIEQMLSGGNLDILCLTGSDNLTPEVLQQVTRWIESGKPTLLDEQSGRFSHLSEETNALKKYHGRDNVLVLRGERWDRDADQAARFRRFLDQKLPLSYATVDEKRRDEVTVDYLQSEKGEELAILTRRGPSGRPIDELDVVLQWKKSRSELIFLDPFATESKQSRTEQVSAAATSSTVRLRGFQEVLLILAR